jgi:hypothetical protein
MALYQSGWAWLPAALVFSLGISLYKMGGANFSLKQLQGQPELRGHNEEQRLVTNGIRARVRHPIYLAHLCEMLAWSIGTGLLVCYSLTGLAIVTGAFMIRAEDAELEQRFGDEFRRYKNAVPSVIPALRRPFKKTKGGHGREIAEQLVATLPAGCATMHTEGERFVISPTDAGAARITIWEDADFRYTLAIGAATIIDWLDEDNLRSVCDAVFAGMFEECVYCVGDDLTKATGRLRIKSRILRTSHWTTSYYPFTKKEKKIVRYTPYHPSLAATSSKESPRAL